MIRAGHIQFTLRAGERFRHVPAHIDCLAGAGRVVGRLDRGPLDRALSRYGGGARVSCVYHACASLGRYGEQHAHFDDLEEELGLSRCYRAEIGERESTSDVVKALRDLDIIESAAVQTFAMTCAESKPGNDADRALARRPHEQVNAAAALAMEPGDERVTTAIVDTGIVVGHPEFQRKCLAGYDTCDIGLGRVDGKYRLLGDSRGHDYNPYDDVGHGCHVGGIIGAQGWMIPRGLAGRALLLAIRVLAAAIGERSNRRVGIGCLPDIDAGMKVAVDLGSLVINMSFGTPASSVDPGAPTPHKQVAGYATRKGCVLVAAAGNSGIEEVIYPAALPEVICVASVNERNERSAFSTMGSHVTLSAPGERIVSCGVRGYRVNSGTSFAAPFVAAVASLMVARAMRAGRELGGEQVKSLLIKACRPLGRGFNRETGHGLLDASASLRCLDRTLEARA